jgi:hypothetical protein
MTHRLDIEKCGSTTVSSRLFACAALCQQIFIEPIGIFYEQIFSSLRNSSLAKVFRKRSAPTSYFISEL